MKPSDQFSVTTNVMYQRIDADGYNNYQATGTSPSPYPTTPGVYQPYDVQEPYYDSFKMVSLDAVYDFGPTTLTFVPAYWRRSVMQSTDSTEALQNINNLTQFLQSLYVEDRSDHAGQLRAAPGVKWRERVSMAGWRLRRRSALRLPHL